MKSDKIKKIFFMLFIAISASNAYSSDGASMPTNEQVSQLMSKRKQTEDMVFMMARLGDAEGWLLYKARAALARLAYNSGQNDAAVNTLIGDVMPRRRGESLQGQIDALRIKALEAGLVENLNDLIFLEELEEVNPDNESTKRSFGIR